MTACGFKVQCQQLGASMNLQAACPNKNDNSCKVSCQDPSASNQCVILDTLLIDGSPCGEFTLFLCILCLLLRRTPFGAGYGGSCQNGTCQRGSLLDTAKVMPHLWWLHDLRRSLTDLRLAPARVIFKFYRPGMWQICRSQYRSQLLRPCLPLPYFGVL
jgi:hypothetical protein